MNTNKPLPAASHGVSGFSVRAPRGRGINPDLRAANLVGREANGSSGTLVKIDRKKCRMIAHRGASGLETENTAAAFIAAGNRSYYGIETDVHVTADGQFVIIHDDDTLRVSGEKLPVEGSTLDELRSLTLFARDGTKRGDLIIPTLSEYIRICKHYNKAAVLELKNTMPAGAVLKIADIIKEFDYLENVVFISFSLNNLKELRREYPNQPAQYLTVSDYSGNTPDELTDILIRNNLDLAIHHTAVTKDLTDRLHGEGIKVNAWTVDSPEEAERLISCGVDFITTNILE